MKKFERFHQCEKLEELRCGSVLENNSAVDGWVAAFEEMLKIIQLKEQKRNGIWINAHNLIAIIRDELGMTNDDNVKDEIEFDDIYAKYVIRCNKYGHYIGETKGTTFALRSDGARFTQKAAMKFITDNPFGMDSCDFIIEDAV